MYVEKANGLDAVATLNRSIEIEAELARVREAARRLLEARDGLTLECRARNPDTDVIRTWQSVEDLAAACLRRALDKSEKSGS